MTLPFELPFELPGGADYEPFEGWSSIPGTSLAWLESYCEEGKGLLLSQFREKPLLEAVLCALSDGVQEIENASWAVLTERSLDNAVGAQLDGLGTLLAAYRNPLPPAFRVRPGDDERAVRLITGALATGISGTWSDETYRAILRAQILVLRSAGTWPDLFGVLDALGLTLELVAFVENFPAAMRIDLGEPPSGFTGGDVFTLLNNAKPGAVRLSLVFPTADVDEAFTFASNDTPEIDAGRGFGDATGADVGGVLACVLATTETA